MAPCDGPGERAAPDFSAGGGFGAICRNCRGDGRGGWRAASRFRVDGEESGIPSGMHELLERYAGGVALRQAQGSTARLPIFDSYGVEGGMGTGL
jgi:hypothetical protein